MVNIHIILIAYALPDDVWALFESLNGDDVTWHLYLHSRAPDILAACRRIALHPNVFYNAYGINRGLAKSWNEGLLAAYARGADVALIANDDVSATRADLHKIAAAAYAQRDAYLVTGSGMDAQLRVQGDMLLALAAINPIALEGVGCFDENFFPIYYEDVDWYRRATLAGLRRHTVKDTVLIHAGSKTLRTLTTEGARAAHEWTFKRNRDYYTRKWGGDKGDEQFTTPFNAEFGYRIAPDARHAPYPGHNREDIP